jgi:phosphoribosyl-ATP pyrophosphohydrolase
MEKGLSELKCNQPKKTPNHPKKSHVVKACRDGKEKIVRFGEQGAETVPGKPKNEKERKKKKSFHARHDCANAKDGLSARHWSCKTKW